MKDSDFGCQCPSCKYTNSFASKGFDSWPRGDPAGRKSVSDYSAHVRATMSGGITRRATRPAGVDFYGVPSGSTRMEREEVLRRTFASIININDYPI